MNTKPDLKKPAPPTAKGRPFDRTEAELDALSRITAADIHDARALWERNAPDEFKGLLDARPSPNPRPES